MDNIIGYVFEDEDHSYEDYSSNRMIKTHFNWDELCCPCENCLFQGGVRNDVVIALEHMRRHLGFPLKITSGYRCTKHNEAIGGAKTSYHIKGLAVDIAVSDSDKRYRILQIAFRFGFRGIAMGKNFVHLDMREGKRVTWLY